MAKIECIVLHPNLHLAVGGKLQQMAKNGTITVEEKHVQRYLDNGALKRFGEEAAVEISGNDELKARAKELNIANYSKMKDDTLKQKIAEAEAAVAKAEAAVG